MAGPHGRRLCEKRATNGPPNSFPCGQLRLPSPCLGGHDLWQQHPSHSGEQHKCHFIRVPGVLVHEQYCWFWHGRAGIAHCGRERDAGRRPDSQQVLRRGAVLRLRWGVRAAGIIPSLRARQPLPRCARCAASSFPAASRRLPTTTTQVPFSFSSSSRLSWSMARRMV